MSCDHELANEWIRCSGSNANYITIIVACEALMDVESEKFIGCSEAILR